MRTAVLGTLLLLGAVFLTSLPTPSQGEEENDVCPGCDQFEKVGAVLDDLTDTLNSLKDRVSALDGAASDNQRSAP